MVPAGRFTDVSDWSGRISLSSAPLATVPAFPARSPSRLALAHQILENGVQEEESEHATTSSGQAVRAARPAPRNRLSARSCRTFSDNWHSVSLVVLYILQTAGSLFFLYALLHHLWNERAPVTSAVFFSAEVIAFLSSTLFLFPCFAFQLHRFCAPMKSTKSKDVGIFSPEIISCSWAIGDARTSRSRTFEFEQGNEDEGTRTGARASTADCLAANKKSPRGGCGEAGSWCPSLSQSAAPSAAGVETRAPSTPAALGAALGSPSLSDRPSASGEEHPLSVALDFDDETIGKGVDKEDILCCTNAGATGIAIDRGFEGGVVDHDMSVVCSGGFSDVVFEGESTSRMPIVAVCVCRYKEPLEDLLLTMHNMLNIQYPPDRLHLHILDDGFHDRSEDFRRQQLTALQALVGGTHTSATPDGLPESQVYVALRPDCATHTEEVVLREPTDEHCVVSLIARRKPSESHFKVSLRPKLPCDHFSAYVSLLHCPPQSTHLFPQSLQVDLPRSDV